jgi:hypothetical protein
MAGPTAKVCVSEFKHGHSIARTWSASTILTRFVRASTFCFPIFSKTHWSQGKDVELTELILQTQTPPFDKLGAFPVDTFFPAKDRMELAMC